MKIDVPVKGDPRFRGPPADTVEVDRRRLQADLRSALAGEVRFSAGDRALYAAAGANYRQVPIGVVIPRSVDDVVATVAIARDHGVPVLSLGGHTSLAGQGVNVAVVIDFSKYLNRVLDIDVERRLARVEPGVVLDVLRREAGRHGLTFGPDPSTHSHCTLGGMIGNNSCGVHSVMTQFYGPGPTTAHNVHELEILTYRGDRFTVGPTPDAELERIIAEGGAQGEIYRRLRDLRDRVGAEVRRRYPDIPRRVSGYNLNELLPEKGFNVARALTGTESTCVTILEATVHLVPSPAHRTLVVIGYEDAATAADHVPAVLEHKPIGLEGMDETLAQDMTLVGIHDRDLSLLPEGRGWLIVELGGETKEEADERGRALIADLERTGGPTGSRLYDDSEQEGHVWKVREAGLGATAFIPGKPDTYEGWEDSAVPPERLGEYLRSLGRLAAKYGYESALYGHYGQGCVHARWNFDLVTAEGIRQFRSFLDEAADLVLSLGGSLSGEHGDGQSRAELLPKMFGEELVGAFREFKSIWDPDWRMNPGKVVDPYRITDNLRLGTDYRPPDVDTHFSFPRDGGSFAHATVRCVGIGNCRRTETEGEVMCPSYLVTREEKHSTRGRARLLFEMLRGRPLEGGWRSREVYDALDLCLSCKGCTSDCPVGVDMPTLKSEFLSHYWKRRLRPRHAYAFGLIDQAARVASRIPGAVNLVTQSPGSSRLAKLAAGMAPERSIPRFAPRTFTSWYRDRGGPKERSGSRVILWPDTFTNHFHPEIGIAAVEVLEHAGYRVELPGVHVCCGRPLYDYGMLDLARRYLLRTLDLLREDIRAGVPVIGLEPSCLAVFRDELPNMLPDDEDAKRLSSQAFHFSEFLDREGVSPPPLVRSALLHGHCHHHATGGIGSEQRLLERMGVDVDVSDSGCCGMAGSFGFEDGHYEVSMACGERALLPNVRGAPADAFLVADGFSCRTQIEQAHTGRSAVHVAQVLQLALEHGPGGPPAGAPPEAACRPVPAGDGPGARRAAAAGAAAVLVAAGLAVRARRRA
ncbi:MAG TPA: FAD-linked oxidase C-terminal domain-containing protein [Gaiellales bacterium]|nr:FAD-linked oxidase C-terminal domain-containing protein [Gaiellales bacterium]